MSNNIDSTTFTPTVLFDGDATGNVTLNDDANNYDYLEIFYKTGADISRPVSSVKIPTITGVVAALLASRYDSSANVMTIELTTVSISGNTLTKGSGMRWQNVWGSSNVTATNNSNQSHILQVLGYKMP